MMNIVFATHNPHKFIEIQEIIPANIKLLSLEDIGCHEDIKETANTIQGNAIIKAKYVYENYNYPCFADDTGLFVEALNGDPGVYSARYAGAQKDAKANNEKLLQNLQSVKNRKAFFKTVIAYQTNNLTQTFTGICEGKILKSIKGKEGFGYDPIFKPKGYDQTFAEMDTSIKNKISHRAKALKEFMAYLNT